MPRFNFQAKDRSGTSFTDQIEATSLQHAQHLLTDKNLFVIQISEVSSNQENRAEKSSSATKNAFDLQNLLPKKAKQKDIPIKTEQLAQLLTAGMRLSEALSVLSKRSSDKSWGTIFESLRMNVVSGKSLSDSMSAHPQLFSPMFRSMVAAGETSGHLVEILQRLSEYLQRREAIQQKVIQSMIYPCIIISVGIGTVVFFMTVMLPQLADMFKNMGKDLPLATQILIGTSRWLIRYGWIVPVAIVFLIWISKKWLKNPDNKLQWDLFKLKIPLVGNLLALNEYSRFTQTLATLLKSGVTLVEALQVAEATLVNTGLKAAIHDSRILVKEGKSLNEALGMQKLFPDLMLDMLAVGEKTGDLAGALHHTAQSYDRDLNRAIQTFTSLIEPFLIVLMAIFVGSIVISVLLAVFDLTSQINKGPR